MSLRNDQQLVNAFWDGKNFLKRAKFLISEVFALIELLIRKQQVIGSIPITGSILNPCKSID